MYLCMCMQVRMEPSRNIWTLKKMIINKIMYILCTSANISPTLVCLYTSIHIDNQAIITFAMKINDSVQSSRSTTFSWSEISAVAALIILSKKLLNSFNVRWEVKGVIVLSGDHNWMLGNPTNFSWRCSLVVPSIFATITFGSEARDFAYQY